MKPSVTFRRLRDAFVYPYFNDGNMKIKLISALIGRVGKVYLLIPIIIQANNAVSGMYNAYRLYSKV